MKKSLVFLLLVVVLLVVWFFVLPSGVDPAAWTPPPAQPLTGAYAKNDLLKDIQPVDIDIDSGPISLTVDAISRIYVGYADGRIIRLENDGTTFVSFAKTVGRPLAMSFDSAGELAVIDSVAGPVHFDLTGIAQPYRITATPPARAVTDVERGTVDYTMFFTDSSSKFDNDHSLSDLLEHRPNGRLLSHNLKNHKTRLLLPELYHPTGVTLGPDDAYVLVSESNAYRITRLWLSGEKAGKHEAFVDNLPGLPGDISFNGTDRFWVSIPYLRNDIFEGLADKPWLRRLIGRLPSFLQGWLHQTDAGAFVLGFDLDGKLIANLQYNGPNGFGAISCVEERNGWLYFGRNKGASIGRFPVSRAIPSVPPPLDVAHPPPQQAKETPRDDIKDTDDAESSKLHL